MGGIDIETLIGSSFALDLGIPIYDVTYGDQSIDQESP